MEGVAGGSVGTGEKAGGQAGLEDCWRGGRLARQRDEAGEEHTARFTCGETKAEREGPPVRWVSRELETLPGRGLLWTEPPTAQEEGASTHTTEGTVEAPRFIQEARSTGKVLLPTQVPALEVPGRR